MSRRTTDYNKAGVAASMGTGTVIAMGVGAGIVGVGIMTLTQKLEQMFTNRPNSLVPGLALARLLGKPDSEKGAMMWPMHWGAGIIAAVVRATLSYNGYRGPYVDFFFTGFRLAFDHSLENTSNAATQPWTWPISEQMIDLCYKTIYGFTTGYFCDLWIQ